MIESQWTSDFWRDFNETSNYGDTLRDLKRDEKKDSAIQNEFDKGRARVHKKLNDEKLVKFVIEDQPMKYRSKIITPLQEKVEHPKSGEIPFWSPLYLIREQLVDDLLHPRWIAEVEKNEKIAELDDLTKGSLKKEALEAEEKLEEMEQKTDEKIEVLRSDAEEETKGLVDSLILGLKDKKIEGEKESSNQLGFENKSLNADHALQDIEVLNEKLNILENTVIDIRMKQNERIERERKQVQNEGREISEIKGDIRKAYGDPEAMKKVLKEFEEVKTKQEERINREKHGVNIGDEINKLRKEVNEINRKQMERIEIQALGLQEKRDKQQDDLLFVIKQKDDEQDRIIVQLQAEIKVLKDKLSSL